MSKKSLDEGSDYQIGAHDIDKTTSLSSDELIEFDYESAAVFKRLADDIYESAEAGIREPLQNALTAVRRAVREGYINSDKGVVKIESQDGEQVTVSLQDNGIGISRNVLEQVLAVIGRSQSRDDGDLSGKYGMGFLAFYKIVGVDGGFFMFTNSRETDEKSVRGIWRPGGFEVDTENELPAHFDENEYGTRFEFTAKQGIDINQIRSWVENHARWAQIPVIYEEYNEDGKVRYEEEYGISQLDDAHSDADFPIRLNNDYFKCICSSEAESRTLLLNSPINRNSNYKSWRRGGEAPNSFDIRLKNENGVVVKGPHKGLMPVSKSEYENMDESRRDNYVPDTQLNLPSSDEQVMKDSIDICVPKPTGTRDTLSKNKWFWSYLQKRIDEKARSEVQSSVDSVDTPTEFMSLDEDRMRYIEEGLSTVGVTGSTSQNIKSSIRNELDTSVSDEMCNFYAHLRDEVFVISEGTKPAKAQRKYGKGVNETEVVNIVSDEDISACYMSVSMNETKMKAVWDSGGSVIRVKKSDYYQPLGKLFNWRQMKEIREFVDESELRDDVRESLFSTGNGSNDKDTQTKPIEDRDITIHRKNRKNHLTVSDAREEFKDGERNLILFPSNCDLKLSDYYDITSSDISVANCLVKMWKELKDVKNVCRVENWFEKIAEQRFKTSSGVLTTEEISELTQDENSVVFHPVGDDYDVFCQERIMNQMRNLAESEDIKDRYSNKIEGEDIVYVPVDSSDLNRVRSYIFHVHDSYDGFYTISNGNLSVQSLGDKLKTPSNLYWYAWCSIKSWRNTDRLRALQSSSYELNNSWIDKIDSISDRDKSIDHGDSYPPESRTFKTNLGDMSVQDMKNQSKLIVLHIAKNKAVRMLRRDCVIDDLLTYIADNEDTSFRNESIQDKVDSLREVIYVPVTKGEATHINEIVHDEKIHAICGDKRHRMSDGTISSDALAYASARLPEDRYEMFVPTDGARSVKPLEKGAYEIIEELASSI